MQYPLHDSQENRQLSMSQALGQSESFLKFQEQLSRVAPVERPVLILGERGTGKELAAARIHFLSHRWQRPLVTLNCAALTPTLIGSELFGYERGAFTGALSRQAGRFEKASEGTLFLDEIGAIPLDVQEKILRVVEYGSFERVGSSAPVQADVRIVAATNADLAQMAESGSFKRDLLDRLSFEVIYVPPLRHRQEDILLLAEHFAGRMAFELGWEEVPLISGKAQKALEAHAWPGNVRELKNVVERAVYKSNDPHEIRIDAASFDPFRSPYGETMDLSDVGDAVDREIGGLSRKGDDPSGPDRGRLFTELMENPLKRAVRRLETHRISQALESCRFNQKKAAQQLGLSYDQFRGLKQRLGL